MFAKKFSTISIATLAALGALALSTDGASARQGGGGGMRGGMGGGFHAAAFHGGGLARTGGFRQVGWGYRRHHYGWGLYGAPLLVGAGAYALDCYYVRRYGALYKVCE